MKYAALAFVSLSLLLNPATALADELSHEEMVCALNPQCAMPFADRRLRGVTATPSVRPPLSFDVTVNFALDSAELTADSRAKLDRVAAALTDPTTKKFDIVISGHTDARGTAEYNQALSERRAEAVRRYLVTQHGIDQSRLAAKGYGKSQLLLPGDPNNDLNRRVQFLNPNVAQKSPSGGSPTASTSRPTPASASRPAGTSAAEGDGM
jgi:outer membrane protein OmpA-like peptidoglycan-associated protein